LIHQFSSTGFGYFKYRGKEKESVVCSMPSALSTQHTQVPLLKRPIHYVQKMETQAILLIKGLFVPSGIRE
jgi:hypothetical protein